MVSLRATVLLFYIVASSIGVIANLTEDLRLYIQSELQRLCPYDAQCHGHSRKVLKGNPISCCPPCSCYDHCEVLGNCCPDKRLVEGDSPLKISKDMFQCTSSVLSIRNSFADHYYMISRCPVGYLDILNSSVKTKCENSTRKTMAEIVPVFDRTSNITFVNKYCAMCHGVVNWTRLGLQVTCHSIVLGGVSTLQTSPLLHQTLDDIISSSNCLVSVVPLEDWGQVDKCSNIQTVSICPEQQQTHPEQQQDNPEQQQQDNPEQQQQDNPEQKQQNNPEQQQQQQQQQNQQQQQQHDNPEQQQDDTRGLLLKEACRQYNTFYNRKYNNIFCAVCSGEDITGEEVCHRSAWTGTGRGFSSLLKHEPSLSEVTISVDGGDQCAVGEWKDTYKGNCRKVFCPLRLTRLDDHCSLLFEYMGRMTLKLFITITTADQELRHATMETKTSLANQSIAMITGDRRDLLPVMYLLEEEEEEEEERPEKYKPYTMYIISMINVRTVRERDILLWLYNRLKSLSSYQFTIGKKTHTFHMLLESYNHHDWNRNVRRFPDRVGITTIYRSKAVGIRNTVPFTKFLFCEQILLTESEYVDEDWKIKMLASNRSLLYSELLPMPAKNGVRVCISDYVPQETMGAGRVKTQITLGVISVSLFAVAVTLGACLSASAMFYVLFKNKMCPWQKPVPVSVSET